jgi:hypothetical protein
MHAVGRRCGDIVRVKASGIAIILIGTVRYITAPYATQVKHDSRVRHRTLPYGTAEIRDYQYNVQ